MSIVDVLVVGAGPSGLATAIAAKQRQLSCAVLERGALVNTVLNYPTNMVFFTTPELLEIGDVPFTTPYDKPTRFEALRYYRRVVEMFDLPVTLGEEVLGFEPDVTGSDPILRVETRSDEGGRRLRLARHVVVATGAFDCPNLLGIPGEGAAHVSHYYRESHPYFRQRVVVVGGKNSAAEAALDLYRSGVHVTLVHRRPALSNSIKYWVKPDIENRLKEGSIAGRLNSDVVEIKSRSVLVRCDGATQELPADSVLLLTGYHSDVRLFERLGIAYDPVVLKPVCDETDFESNVPNVFIVGSAMTGRQSGKIFIENGRFHGQRVIEVIAARRDLSSREIHARQL